MDTSNLVNLDDCFGVSAYLVNVWRYLKGGRRSRAEKDKIKTEITENGPQISVCILKDKTKKLSKLLGTIQDLLN